MLYAHLNEPPPPVPARSGLPPAVDEVLATALAKSPGDRYASCGDFADALREALGLDPYDPSRPAGAAPPPTRRTMPMTPPGPPDGEALPALPGARRSPARQPGPTGAWSTWTAVVTADRAYYDSVSAVNDQDTARSASPASCRNAASR